MKAKQTKKLVKLKKQLRRHIRLTFIPHKDNRYKPRLIGRYGLATLLVIILALQVGYNFSKTGTVLGDSASVKTSELLNDMNSERSKQHLRPLVLDNTLSHAAFLKAQDMLKQQYWAHVAPDGTTPWKWFGDVGYNYSSAGENLAKNFRTADAVTTAWMASPEHRANLLGAQYTQVGYAVADGTLDGKPTTLVVALYGAPVASGVVAGAQVATSAPVAHSMGVLTRLGVAIQSMTPALVGSIILVIIAIAVALLAHAYRDKLPKPLRNSWYRHHGLIKAGGMASLCLVVLILYSGGQI